MRIIVVGAGKVGTALCRSLVDEKHDVILIEEKEEVVPLKPTRLSFKTNGLFLLKEKSRVFNFLIMRYLPKYGSQN